MNSTQRLYERAEKAEAEALGATTKLVTAGAHLSTLQQELDEIMNFFLRQTPRAESRGRGLAFKNPILLNYKPRPLLCPYHQIKMPEKAVSARL